MSADMTQPDAVDTLGDRIRSFRIRKGYSLRALAAHADVTASFLSQVERNQVAPSISTLRRICEVLGVTVVEALVDRQSSASIVRASHRQRLVDPNHEIEMEVLVSEASRPFDMLLVKLAPGGATDSALKSHDAREAVFVVSGQARVEFADAHEDVGPGDTIFFSSSTPHRLVNVGRSNLTFISCIAGKY